jgi:hypothetical protein
MRNRRKKAENLILIFLITFVFIQNLFSQSYNFKEFLPLNIGNTWVYHYEGVLFGTFSGYERYRIISTYYAHGETYFKFAHLRVVASGNSNYVVQSRLFRDTAAIRIDSLSGNIYRNMTCNSSLELLVDSLNAGLDDTSFTCYHGLQDTVICVDTTSITYFENLRISRKFYMPGFEEYNYQIYAKNLGLVGFDFTQVNLSCWVTLKGCIINGVVYGDTSMLVGINQISNEVPENYSLSQNYPNPFNPVTKIKFSIPPSKGARGMTQLIIYDILGREITTLVNEQLNPGIYKVEWDGSNYPSGVYFYKLITNEFSETKKMVLIK